MLRRLAVICFCLLTLPALCEPGAKYEVATILEVKPHQSAGASSDVASYEISAQVGDTIYVTLYTDSAGTGTVKYAGGRELLGGSPRDRGQTTRGAGDSSPHQPEIRDPRR